MNNALRKTCLLLFYLIGNIEVAVNRNPPSNGVVDKIIENIFKTYSNTDFPNLDGPTNVNVSFYINRFVSLNEFDMKIVMNFYFRLAWKDERLRFDEEIIKIWNDSEISRLPGKHIPEQIQLSPDYIKNKVFFPDIFFR